MCIEELTSIQEQFTRHLQIIREQSKTLSKTLTLRISSWLKKLCSVVDNYFWRKNRNLYAEVLGLMLLQGNLQCPFDKCPPEGSLPKLTLYQIPFSIRQKLQNNKLGRVAQKQNKQNLLNASNLFPNGNTVKANGTQINNARCKKRQNFALKSMNSLVETQIQKQNLWHEIETLRKIQRKRSSTIDKERDQKKVEKNKGQQALMVTIQQILYFLAKNNKKFQNDRQYLRIIQEIVAFGESQGRNFREMKFSIINQ